MLYTLSLSILVLSNLVLSDEEKQKEEPLSPLCNGRIAERMVKISDTVSRTYQIFVPPSVCASAKADDNGISDPDFQNFQQNQAQAKPVKFQFPIVIVLHDLNHKSNAVVAQLKSYAEKYQFVLLGPQGVQKSWNGHECCGVAREQKIDDVQFIQTLLERVTQDLPLAINGVFIVGFGNGGFLASHLALGAVDGKFKKLTSIAAVSGHTYDLASLRQKRKADHPQIPVLLIGSHGDGKVRIGGCCPSQQCMDQIADFSKECVNIQRINDAWATYNDPTNKNAKKDVVVSNNTEATCFSINPTFVCRVDKKPHDDHEWTLSLVTRFFMYTACSRHGVWNDEHAEGKKEGGLMNSVSSWFHEGKVEAQPGVTWLTKFQMSQNMKSFDPSSVCQCRKGWRGPYCLTPYIKAQAEQDPGVGAGGEVEMDGSTPRIIAPDQNPQGQSIMIPGSCRGMLIWWVVVLLCLLSFASGVGGHMLLLKKGFCGEPGDRPYLYQKANSNEFF